MKLLLTIIMTTLVSASAFAACGTDKPSDCKDARSCEALSKSGGVQYAFSGTCMAKETAQATNCLEVSDSTLGKGSSATGTSSSDTGTSVQGR